MPFTSVFTTFEKLQKHQELNGQFGTRYTFIHYKGDKIYGIIWKKRQKKTEKGKPRFSSVCIRVYYPYLVNIYHASVTTLGVPVLTEFNH